MRHMQSVPWQVKIAAKIVLARLPLPYHFWEKIGLFKQGGMDRPEYALRIFRRHFDAASLTGKADGFVGLELGPGDSLDSALIAKTFGASKTFLVDVESCASTDLGVYRQMESHLRQLGMYPPNLDHCKTIDDVAESCGAEYLTEGLTSLRKIPSASVDFVWSSQSEIRDTNRNKKADNLARRAHLAHLGISPEPPQQFPRRTLLPIDNLSHLRGLPQQTAPNHHSFRSTTT
jgi:hypothetical protein